MMLASTCRGMFRAAIGMVALCGLTLAHATGTTASTIALASSLTSPYVGQSVTLTATVSPSAATGTVIFKDGATAISGCTSTISAGVATCTASFSAAGTHSITASYGGDATYAISTSAAVSEVVKAQNTTSTTVTSGTNPSLINTAVVFTATVTGGNPTGSVKFYSASGYIGSSSLDASGHASFSNTYTTAGSRGVQAVYVGDTANAGSTSASITQVVNYPPAATTTISSSENPTELNKTVTLTANVVGTNPTGTVQFYSASGYIGAATLVNGIATFTYSWSTTGSRSVEARYLGDTYNGGSSGTLTEKVYNIPGVALASNASTVKQFQNVVLTATVTPSYLTGNVTFMDGATQIGTATLSSGTASLTTSFNAAGTHSLTVTYPGQDSAATGPGTSNTVTETVTAVQQTTTTAVTSSANPVAVGTPLTLAASVTGSTPTGTVQFKDGAAALGSPVTLVSGAASLSVTPSSAGGHSYSAAYSGDSTNASSTGTVAVNVTGSTSTTALSASTSSATPSTSVTFTATVSGSSPTGTVTFREGATTLHSVVLNGGVATWSQTLSSGVHAIVASYAGDATNAASTSSQTLVQVSADGSAQPGAALQVTYEYDAQGNLTKAIDANAAATKLAYDSLSRSTQVTQPVPASGQAAPIIGLGYDLQDQPATVTDPRSLTTTYTTDGLGNTTSQVSPDTGTTTRTFYDDGSLKTSKDARNRTATYTYDALGRVKTVNYDLGVGTTYTYDETSGGNFGIGHLTTMTDESGTTKFFYDGLGHLLSKTQTTGPSAEGLTVSYSWGTSGTATGKLQTVTYPSGAKISYGYDTAGRVSNITVTGADGVVTNVLSGLSYTALNQPQSWVWGVAGVAYQRDYDGYGRLVSYPLGNPAGTGIAAGVKRTLGFDAAGRIVGYSHTTPTNWDQVFGYDGLDRLTSAAVTGGSTFGYAYDATGNRTQRTINGTNYPSPVSATSNWYTSVSNAAGTASQGYDAAGHLTSDATGTYTYSPRGRLSSSLISGNTFSYLYNALEQRVYKSGPSSVITTGTAYYAYDEAGHLIGEYDATGKAVYETVYLGDMPVAALSQPALNQTTVSYVYADHLNTARVIVRPTDQAIVWSWGSNEPFGQTQANSNPNGLGTYTYNPRMPGQVADAESGWFYNWHRDYRPALGGYTESDPLGLGGGSMTTYGYVNAGPLSNTDESGLAPGQSPRYTKPCGRCVLIYDTDNQKGPHTHWKCPGQPQGCIRKDGTLCDGSAPPPPDIEKCLKDNKRIPQNNANACSAAAGSPGSNSYPEPPYIEEAAGAAVGAAVIVTLPEIVPLLGAAAAAQH